MPGRLEDGKTRGRPGSEALQKLVAWTPSRSGLDCLLPFFLRVILLNGLFPLGLTPPSFSSCANFHMVPHVTGLGGFPCWFAELVVPS